MKCAPVLLIIFNRPDLTRRTFNQLKKAKIPKLYLAADGPRSEEEKQLCEEARKAVLDNINWPCEINTMMHQSNVGCKNNVSGAIDWFFENELEGIILEDDCLPGLTFLKFCSELLIRYRDNHRVYHISGSNELNIKEYDHYDYSFTKFPFIWGWATWKDRWAKYDVNMTDYPIHKEKVLKHYSKSTNVRFFLNSAFSKAFKGISETWDHQWAYTIFKENGIAVLPKNNLTSNIGYDHRATHTTHFEESRANLPIVEIKMPIKHPEVIEINEEADQKWESYLEGLGLYQRTKRSWKHKLKLTILGTSWITQSFKEAIFSKDNFNKKA